MTAMPALDRRSDYVSAVAVELGDLAPDDRAELIEELDDHIAALLEDRPDVDLVGELGTPRAYAAELRAAAGLGSSASSRTGVRDLAREVRARLVVSLPWLPGLLRTLRPAWWVLRGALAAFAVDLVTGFEWRSAQGVVVLALGVAASLWLAQHPPKTRSYQVAVIVLDVAAVVALAWVAWFGHLSQSDVAGYDTQYVQNCPIELDNLYAYDASGKPLQNVRLFDQNGNPFDASIFNCNYDSTFAPSGDPNVYPWPTASYGDDGAPTGPPTGPPTSLAPLPGATVSSSATPSVSPTPTTSPTR